MTRRYLRLSGGGRRNKRLAVPNVGFPWLLPNREPTAALNPMAVAGQGGQPGTYDEIARGWPVVAEYVDDMTTALGAAKYHWTPPEDPTPDEERFCDLMADLSDTITVDRTNGLEGIGALAETWVQYWTNGVYVGEVRAIEAPHRRAHRAFGVWQGCDLEVYPIHPSTIQQWQTDHDTRRLTGIRQQGASGGATIPVESLVWVQRQGVVGEYVGISALRALAFPFERWKAISLAAQHSSSMQGGCMIFKAGKNIAGGVESYQRMQQTASGWANSLAPYLILEEGWEAEFVSPSGSANFDQLEYWDGLAKSKLGKLVGALVDSASGHRALGEVVATQEQQQRTDELSLFLGRFGTRLARWVADRCAYGGRLPSFGIQPTDKTVTPAERIATAAAAITAFGITPTPADQQWAREVATMPVEELPAVEVVPAAGEVVEMAEELIPPDGAADSAAAAVQAWYDTPVAERGLSGRELELAKRIAAMQPISAVEARMLSVWFRSAGDPTPDPTWATKGRAYQAWHGRGGQAMAEWLRAMHEDRDGVPTPTPPPAPAPVAA